MDHGVGRGLPRTVATRRVSWGALLAGVVVALAIHLLLVILAAAVGSGLVDPILPGASRGATRIGSAVVFWWAISCVAAAFGGAWVAARLAAVRTEHVGRLYGVAVWALTTLPVAYVINSTAGALSGGALNFGGQTVSGAGPATSGAAWTLAAAVEHPLSRMQGEITQAVNANDPEGAGEQLAGAMRRVLTGDDEAAAEARQTAVDVLRRQGLPRPEAEERILEWQQQFRSMTEQAGRQARDATEATANAGPTASLASYIALLLGVIAGAIGGRIGTPSRLSHES